MSENTTSLQTLRRKIALELQMPFAKRYGNGYLDMDSGSTTTKIVDSALTQRDGFWNGGWFYRVASQEVSLIRSFEAAGKSFQLEVPLASSPSAGDDYEIHSMFNAYEIRHAINEAIHEASRTWYDSVVDETLVLTQDKLEYDLSAFTKKPWVVAKVYIESRSNVKRGVLVSATSTTFTVENTNVMSDIGSGYANWYISIYSGTGKGQIRALAGVSGADGTVTAWTTTPDSTSKYAIWNGTEDLNTWQLLDRYRFDNKEFPNTLYLFGRYENHYGMRLHIEYISQPGELSAEADTTIVPSRYIMLKAVSLLHGQRVKDVKADKEIEFAESERYKEAAEMFRVQNMPHKPDITMKRPMPSNSIQPQDNPLNWT